MRAKSKPVPDVLRVLSAPRRRAILRVVWEEERAAGEIHAALGDLTFGAVSQHLAVLLGAGLVQVRREGRSRRYRARPAELGPLRAWLEASWDQALSDLTRLAEAEERPRRRRKT